MELDLKDRVFVVNGGTRGLGKDIVTALCREGASVAFSGRNSSSAGSVLEEAENSGGQAIFIKADIRKADDCRNLIETAADRLGKISGLVNYAGITTRGAIDDIDEDTYYDVFDTNFKSVFFCCKYAIRSMLETGGGSIVNIGSTLAYGGSREMSVYSCSKGAVLTLTKHIANNYAGHNIRANWVTMGWVATPGELSQFQKAGRDIGWEKEQAKKIMPMGRLQTGEDNVPGVLYLLSNASSQVTGTELHISGGFFPGIGSQAPRL